ncbi:MAG: ABC transporter permease, partial [Bacteroides sp.]|nr:ABC transporter permease [Bacteroides sp.]
MIKHYLKLAVRHLLKYRTQNLISIIGLSVGLLCFSFCLYCSRFVEGVDDCFPQKKRIAELVMYNEESGLEFSGTSVSMAEEFRNRHWAGVQATTSVVYPRERSYTVETADGRDLPYTLQTVEVDTFYNEVFTPQVLAGHWPTAVHTPNALVMTRSTAVRIFGSAVEAIGKRLTLTSRLYTSPDSTPRTGGIGYTVQAVVEDIPLNNSFKFMAHIDLLVMNDSEGLLQNFKRKGMTGSDTYVLLAPEVDAGDLTRRLKEEGYTYTLYKETYSVVARSMGERIRQGPARYLSWIAGAVGTLIGLVGLINFFHFLIGFFLNRTKEYSIMKVAGCSGRQLFGLLLTQLLMVVLLSALLVLCGIELIGDRMDFSLMKSEMRFDVGTLMAHVGQYTLWLMGIGAVVCLLVSVRIRRISIQEGIRGTGKRRGRQWGRNLMLGIQFFICWVFFALTVGLYLQSRETSQALFPSLSLKEKAEILSIPLAYDCLKHSDKLALVERFKQHAAVKDVMLADIGYLAGVSGNTLMTEKGNNRSWIEMNIIAVPTNFFSFMNIPVEEGRGPETKNDLVVDRTWQAQRGNVIGMNLYDTAVDYTVCGVCASFRTDVYDPSRGYAFIPFDASEYVGHCYLKCHAGRQDEVAGWVRGILRESLPESITPQVRTLLDDIHEQQALEYKLKDIILFFAVVSILITLLGVYSSITLDTERRQKEVAIRKVNGAGTPQIIRLFARLYVVLLVVSAVIAFPLIYGVLTVWRRMYTVFFDHGFLFWAGIFLVVAFITACTVFYRILKIARV